MKTLLLTVSLLISLAAPRLASGDEWLPLFDGQSFDGWQANERPETWSIKEGAIVARGERSHLFYVGDMAGHNFKNFEFAAEVMTKPGSNSGIYVHTRYQEVGWPESGYECQLINSNPPVDNPLAYVEHKMTGSIYAVRNTWEAPVEDNVWFDYRIVVSGKTIQTFIDGELVCEYTEPESPWRPGDKKRRLLSSGTFALQGHDPDSEVHFKRLRVKLLPDDAPSLGEPLEDPELDRLITKFSDSNHPLIDLGVRQPSEGGADERAATARKYGMTLSDVSFYETPPALYLVNDRDFPPVPAGLRAAVLAGSKIAFSSGGDEAIDEGRLKKRLEAMEDSGIDWRSLWVPGK